MPPAFFIYRVCEFVSGLDLLFFLLAALVLVLIST